MKLIIEEYGVLIITCLIGTVMLGVGSGLLESITPVIETYLMSIM